MRKGFTLIELLVVLIIIGILVALILPNTLRAIRQGNVKECASNIRSIDTALNMCFTERNDWATCSNLPFLAANGYFPDAVAPTCPFGAAYNFVPTAAGGMRVDTANHFAAWPNVGDHL